MSDPYRVLGLPVDAGDEQIRRRYLELIKLHSPEKDAERFSAIRSAYEALRDRKTRIENRLFGEGQNDHLEDIVEQVQSLGSRRRVSLQQILSLVRKP
jgi:curved DNA-binding protein CbpA